MQTTASSVIEQNRIHKPEIIMVIDDSIADRFIAEKLISRNNLAQEIVIKESAIDALEYLRKIKNSKDIPDVIFLDIRMPGMDGFEFLENIKNLPETLLDNCIIYMLTSSGYIEDKKRADGYPYVKGFITKPLTEKVLLSFFE